MKMGKNAHFLEFDQRNNKHPFFDKNIYTTICLLFWNFKEIAFKGKKS